MGGGGEVIVERVLYDIAVVQSGDNVASRVAKDARRTRDERDESSERAAARRTR